MWTEDYDFLDDLDRFDPDFPINADRFPSVRPDIDLPQELLERIVRRPRPQAIDDLRRRIRGKFGGSPSGSSTGGLVPPPDALAVYLPFHVYPHLWGIYLLDAGVASLAFDLHLISLSLGHPLSMRDARKVACVYLFHHEAYHCAVESFAVRCEIAARKGVYLKGATKLYRRAYTPGDPHEETLATAYGIRKVRDVNLPRDELDRAIYGLKAYMGLCAKEYANGTNFIADAHFYELENRFMEEVMRTSLRRSIRADLWDIGTHMTSPLLQRNRKFSWICKRADFYNRSRLAVHYFRRSNVIACLQKLSGARLEAGGKHEHLVTVSGSGSRRRTQVPSGEVPRGTLSGMLRDLEIDLNVHEFREECRKARCAI